MRSLGWEFAVKMSLSPSLSTSAITEHHPDRRADIRPMPLDAVASVKVPGRAPESLRNSGKVSPEMPVRWMSSQPSLS